MSEPVAPAPTPATAGPPPHALITAAALLLLYIGLTIAMMSWFSAEPNERWDRVLLIYNGFTAFGLAAGGVLLGTQIQQANVTAARRESDAARGEAERVKQAARNALAATEATTMRSATPPDLAEVRSMLVQAL